MFRMPLGLETQIEMGYHPGPTSSPERLETPIGVGSHTLPATSRATRHPSRRTLQGAPGALFLKTARGLRARGRLDPVAGGLLTREVREHRNGASSRPKLSRSMLIAVQAVNRSESKAL